MERPDVKDREKEHPEMYRPEIEHPEIYRPEIEHPDGKKEVVGLWEKKEH